MSALGAIVAAIWVAAFLSTGVSSEGLPSDAGTITVSQGYSVLHDRVRFMIVREWPSNWSVEQRAHEPHVRMNALGRSEVLVPSVGWQRVKDGGNIYVFDSGELRTMTVEMNTHSDQFEMGRCRTVDEIWEFLQQYRVTE